MPQDVVSWLGAQGLGKYADTFIANDVDLKALALLTADDLKELGVSLGHRRKLLAALHGAPVKTVAQLPPERRVLTVMFIDIIGSVELSQRLDAEAMRELTKHFQSAVTAATTRYEGYVANFLGDGVLCYFGWPQAHEDEAERAVRAARDAYAAIREITWEGRPVLSARAGVATGEVVVGTIVGDVTRDEAAAFGPTLGLANRLQTLARPFEVVVATLTRTLIGGVFDFENIGRYELKGFDEPVDAWRVAMEVRAPSRFEILRTTTKSVFVGRHEAMQRLSDGWRTVKKGSGRGVLVRGDAGIGKSRLVEEFRQSIKGERRFGFRYQCSPYHTNEALHPVIQTVRRMAGVDEGDSAAVVRDKLSTLFTITPEIATAATSVFAAVFGVAADDAVPLSGSQLRREAIAMLVEHIVLTSRQHPTSVVFEDLHWSDASTLEFIGALLDRAPDERILFVSTCRPSFVSRWRESEHWSEVLLERIGRQQSLKIIESVAGDKLSEDVRETISKRADGVPLFVEELTKTALEDRSGVDSRQVPTTLRTSLQSRLDTFGENAIVAQIGSVLGRTFEFEHIRSLAARSLSDVEASLDALVEGGLLLCDGVPPNAQYSFTHALIQDAAYETLLVRERRDMHASFADLLEERGDQSGDRQDGLIALHADRAEDWERAFWRYRDAGQGAAARAALVEAEGHFRSALKMFERVPNSIGLMAHAIDVRFELRNVLWATGQFEAILPTLERAEVLANNTGDEAKRGWISVYRAASLWQLGRAADSRRASEGGLRIAEETGDAGLKAAAQFYHGCVTVTAGDLKTSERYFEELVASLSGDRWRDPCGLPFLPSIIARSWLVYAYADRGDFAASEAIASEAMALAAATPNPFNTAHVKYDVGYALTLQERYDEAVATLTDAIDAIERYGMTYLAPFTRGFLGYAHVMAGNVKTGETLLADAVAEYERLGLGLFQALVRSQWAHAQLLAGQPQAAEATLDQALALATEREEHGFEAFAHFVAAEIDAARGDSGSADAAERYRYALSRAEALGLAPLELRCREALLCRQQTLATPKDAVAPKDAVTPISNAEKKAARALRKRLGLSHDARKKSDV